MPDTSRNQLANLAERLKFHAEVAESGHALDDHASIDLNDAYRIVTELAKVGNLYNNEGWPPDMNPRMMILKCRAIAEKGAEYEKVQ